MNQFPHEFEALLSRTGRKVLAGTQDDQPKRVLPPRFIELRKRAARRAT